MRCMSILGRGIGVPRDRKHDSSILPLRKNGGLQICLHSAGKVEMGGAGCHDQEKGIPFMSVTGNHEAAA
jgi:hypothetical protein